jgi:hypothetical protein
VGFALAAARDLLWHTVFGIEQNIDILFSPTHLGLLVAMLVILTTPLRAMWADRSMPRGARPTTSDARGPPETALELTTGGPIVQALAGLMMSFMLVPGGPPSPAAPAAARAS